MSAPLPLPTHRLILKLAAEGKSVRQIAEATGAGIGSVAKFMKIPLPGVRKPGKGLPEPCTRDHSAYALDTAGWWLVLGDVHLPYHDPTTVRLAVKEACKRKVRGVLLNGDVLDSHEVSDHDRDPRAPRYVDEVEAGKQFLGWLRKQLPKARVVLKEGNHEERLLRYVASRAPALFDLEGVTVPELLHCKDFGIEWVGDRRVVQLGKLNVIHGHEYRGGVSTPVNPARGVYLKARSVVVCGHWHRTSEHHERNIRGKSEAAWSVGCACDLSPRYCPLNNWNFGMMYVHVGKDGNFEVDNRRVMDGRVV